MLSLVVPPKRLVLKLLLQEEVSVCVDMHLIDWSQAPIKCADHSFFNAGWFLKAESGFPGYSVALTGVILCINEWHRSGFLRSCYCELCAVFVLVQFIKKSSLPISLDFFCCDVIILIGARDNSLTWCGYISLSQLFASLPDCQTQPVHSNPSREILSFSSILWWISRSHEHTFLWLIDMPFAVSLVDVWSLSLT